MLRPEDHVTFYELRTYPGPQNVVERAEEEYVGGAGEDVGGGTENED